MFMQARSPERSSGCWELVAGLRGLWNQTARDPTVGVGAGIYLEMGSHLPRAQADRQAQLLAC